MTLKEKSNHLKSRWDFLKIACYSTAALSAAGMVNPWQVFGKPRSKKRPHILYMQGYLGSIAAVDEGVGKVLDYLEENALADLRKKYLDTEELDQKYIERFMNRKKRSEMGH